MARRDAFHRVSGLYVDAYQSVIDMYTHERQDNLLTSCSARLGTSRLVTLDLPSALSERVLNALKADPRTVDLRNLAPHFYSLGVRILELFEEEEMGDVLSDVSLSGTWCD